MRIVSLEDDEPFWDLLREALEEGLPGAELTWVRTESEFYSWMPKFAEAPPDIFVLDVMVKWADAAEIMPPAPRRVIKEGYYRAGLRCRARLRRTAATRGIPVILYTVLERGDIEKVIQKLPADTAFVGKSGDFGELRTAIKRLVGSRKASTPAHL